MCFHSLESPFELEPTSPILFRFNNELWEKEAINPECGYGTKLYTLSANKEYKLKIGLNYFGNFAGNGVIMLGAYKSDTFKIK